MLQNEVGVISTIFIFIKDRKSQYFMNIRKKSCKIFSARRIYFLSISIPVFFFNAELSVYQQPVTSRPLKQKTVFIELAKKFV